MRKLAWIVLLCGGALFGVIIPASASVLFQIERVSDTQGILTGSGSIALGTTLPELQFNDLALSNPFSAVPSGTNINDDVYQSSNLQVGLIIVNAAYTCVAFASACPSVPNIYLAGNSPFSPGDIVAGTLNLQLLATYSFAAVGTSGDVFWGLDSAHPPLVGTWEIVGSATTPLPAALPLFATGVGALGLLGRRRKRKAALAAA